MKIRLLLPAIVASVALLIGPQALAETPITFSFGGSQHIYDDDREVDDELFLFGAAELRFTERWAGEFWYSGGETDGDNGFDADIDRWHIDALYYLEERGDLHPYLAFGGGQLKRDWDVPNGNLDDTDEEANAGAGVHYFITDNFSLRADARYLFGFDDSTSDFTLSAGISYRFGGGPVPAAVAPAAEPEPMDSDGDGVYDDMDDCPNTAAGVRVDSRGCEIKVTKVASVKLVVQFEFDKDEVQEHYFSDIEGLAKFLNRFDDIHVDIEGHTDSVGAEAYNQDLSQRRANAVMEVLINEYGISPSRLEAKGFGESQPVATNDTAEGRAENRRVMATLEVEYEE